MRIGDRVLHPQYGEGTIRWLIPERELARVAFDGDDMDGVVHYWTLIIIMTPRARLAAFLTS